MPYQLSRHIWLEPYQDRVAACHAVSRRRVLLSAEDLFELEQVRDPSAPLGQRLVAADLLVSDREAADSELPETGPTLLKVVDRFLAETRSTSVRRLREQCLDWRERLNEARGEALSRLSAPAEHERDVVALFDHLQSFLVKESEPDGFSFTPGFLSRLGERPVATDEYGQLPCMPETTQRRVDLAEPRLTSESRCLVLGDDDLISLYWSLVHPSLPCDVLELDPALLDFLRPRLGPAATLHCCDLTQGLPEAFQQRYDVIYTDPMYGRKGWDMFLRCCRQALSPSRDARVLLTTCRGLIEDGDLLEERIAEAGLTIERTLPGFSRYSLPDATRRAALSSLRSCGLPGGLLQGLLKVPYLYTEMYELRL